MRKAGSVQPFQYRLSELEKATNNFSDRNKLGCGGSGVVYKGKINGRTVAIKKLHGSSVEQLIDIANENDHKKRPGMKDVLKMLTTNSSLPAPGSPGFRQGGPKESISSHVEFQLTKDSNNWSKFHSSEDATTSNQLLQPTVLTKICSLQDVMIATNNFSTQLSSALHYNSQPREWSTLDRIIKGIANGISYLHHGLEEKYLIHGNLNPSTIWLDDSWNAQLSSFSLTRVLDVNESFFKLSSPCGALGYTAPEIYSYLRITTKSDVYSYGITLLRILVDEESGCYFTDFNTIFKVWNKWQQNKILELLDQRIHSCHPKEALCFFQIALLCIQGDPDKRPNMQEVVKMLTSLDDLPVPTPPVFRVQHRH
ncbi:S-locus lectin protein kinase family protein [Rhynchospora pubera]|uniref:S-locus lectin protein kinase family protein n=1 Tax=Rhynchospora pubera TaxID=906938 RepID=A0AAV8HXE1_9POAL|nr:S-locus lectin protein kinase family protein [Rhynchospora pubera]